MMLRNASRAVLSVTVEDRNSWWVGFYYLAGCLGAAGALYLAVPALAGILGTTTVGSVVGSWGALALSAVACAPLALPAFGATFLFATAATGIVVGAVSIFPALLNIGVAAKRTIDVWKGIQHDETVLQNGQSMGDKLRDRRENKVLSAFHALPKAKQDKAVEYVVGSRCPSAEHVLSTLSETEQQKLLAALSAKFAAAATSGTSPVGSAVQTVKPKGMSIE